MALLIKVKLRASWHSFVECHPVGNWSLVKNFPRWIISSKRGSTPVGKVTRFWYPSDKRKGKKINSWILYFKYEFWRVGGLFLVT